MTKMIATKTAVTGGKVKGPAAAGDRPAKTTAEVQTTATPDIVLLAEKTTVADELDLMAYMERAESVPNAEIEKVSAAAAAAVKAFAAVAKQDRNCRAARARSYATTFPLVLDLCHRPEVLCAMAARNAVKITERTAKSVCLTAIKTLFPDLDRREQSAVAMVHNHALANGWGADDLEREIKEVGTVELVKRERQRQRLRAGGAEAPAADDALDRYRAEQRGFPLSQIATPGEITEGSLGLLVVGVIDGELRVFDVDDSEKRVLAAVKHCAKRGCLLKTRSSRDDTPQAAEEGGDDE